MQAWIARHRIRFAVYLLLLAVLIAGALDIGVRDCAVAGRLAGVLAKLPAVSAVLRFESARFACTAADFDHAQLILPGGPVFGAGRVRVSLQEGVLVENAGLGDLAHASQVTAALGGSEVNIAARRISVAGLAEIDSAGVAAAVSKSRIDLSKVALRNVRAGGVATLETMMIPTVAIPRGGQGSIDVPVVNLGASTASLEQRADGTWNVPAAADFQTAAARFGNAYAALAAGYRSLAERLHGAFFWIAIIVIVVVAGAKLALTSAKFLWKAISAAAAVAVGGLLYLGGILNPLLLLAGGMALGIALEAAIYRKAPEWHQHCEPFAIDLVAPLFIVMSLAAHAYVFPSMPSPPAEVAVGSVRAGPSSITVKAAGLPQARITVAATAVDHAGVNMGRPSLNADLVRVTGAAIRTTPASVSVDAPEAVVRNIEVAASGQSALVSASGSAEAPALAEALAQIRYLPASLRRPAPVTFCLNWKLGADLPPACTGGAMLAVRGSLDTADRSRLRYTAETVWRAAGTNLRLDVTGTGAHARITQLVSGPGSSVRIGSGSGEMGFGRGLQATLDLRQIGAGAATIQDFRVNAIRPAAARLDVEGEASGIRAQVRTMDASLGAAHFELHRNGSPLQASAEMRDLHLSDPAWLSANLPLTRAAVQSVWKGGKLGGTVAVDAGAFKAAPLHFVAALNEGTIEIPEQPLGIDQTLISYLPENIGGRLWANSDPNEAHSDIQLDSVAVNLLPCETNLRQMHVTTDGLSRMRFEGRLSAACPALPRSFDLSEVSRLSVSSSGAWRGLRIDSNPFAAWTFPAIPTEFGFSGGTGLPLSVESSSGSLQLEQPSAGIQKLVVQDGALEEVTAAVNLPQFGLTASSSLAGGSYSVSGKMNGVQAFNLSGDHQRLRIGLMNVRLDELWRAAEPSLRGFGLHLDVLSPQAAVGKLDAEFGFAGGRLDRAGASVETEPGPLVELHRNGSLQSVSASAGAPVRSRFSYSAGRVSSDVTAPSLSLDASGPSGGLETKLAMETQAAGTLAFAGPKRAALVQTLSDTWAALQPDLESADHVFGIGAGPVSWKVQLANSSGWPAVTAAPDRWSAKLDWADAAIASGQSHLEGSGRVFADLVSRGGNLFLDSRLRTGPFDLPLLAAVTRDYPDSAVGSGLLWDPAAIARVWDGFVPRNATAGPIRVLDRPEYRFGGLSLQQILLPDQPVPITIGTQPLRVSAPLSGSLLYGTLSGTGQAEITWRGSEACVTSRAAGALNGIQADAVGMAIEDVAPALVADRWDARFAVRTDQLCLDRDGLRAVARDPLSSDWIAHTGLSLQLARSAPVNTDGILQFTTDAGLKPVNDLLRPIVKSLRLKQVPRAMRYRNLSFDFQTEGDRVLNQGPLLTLNGLTLLQGNPAEIDGDLRVYLRPETGEFQSVRNLLEFLRSLQ